MTEIIRPSIFPECKSCIKAQEIIDSWTNFKPNQPYQSIEAVSVEVNCHVMNNTVTESSKCNYRIQFVKGKLILEIPGGSYEEVIIECPHFNKPNLSGR